MLSETKGIDDKRRRQFLPNSILILCYSGAFILGCYSNALYLPDGEKRVHLLRMGGNVDTYKCLRLACLNFQYYYISRDFFHKTGMTQIPDNCARRSGQ